MSKPCPLGVRLQHGARGGLFYIRAGKKIYCSASKKTPRKHHASRKMTHRSKTRTTKAKSQVRRTTAGSRLKAKARASTQKNYRSGLLKTLPAKAGSRELTQQYRLQLEQILHHKEAQLKQTYRQQQKQLSHSRQQERRINQAGLAKMYTRCSDSGCTVVWVAPGQEIPHNAH